MPTRNDGNTAGEHPAFFVVIFDIHVADVDNAADVHRVHRVVERYVVEHFADGEPVEHIAIGLELGVVVRQPLVGKLVRIPDARYVHDIVALSHARQPEVEGQGSVNRTEEPAPKAAARVLAPLA